MPKTRHLFISHSWTHSDHYDKLEALLKEASRFNFINHSVPKDDPIPIESLLPTNTNQFNFADLAQSLKPTNRPNAAAALLAQSSNNDNDFALRRAIKEEIDKSDIVLIIAGVYVTYGKWINIEIDIAKKYFHPKPILAIEHWGAKRTSVPAKDAADKVVKWSTQSIVDAIRELVP